MDLTPRQVMRAIQLGLQAELLGSSTIWVCLSCQTCTVRCPRQIDIARVMESLRLLAVAENSPPAEKDVKLFHRLFANMIRDNGRSYELMLGLMYNLRSRHLFANVKNAPKLLSGGKLNIMPPRAGGKSEVKAIFARVEELERRARSGKGSNDQIESGN